MKHPHSFVFLALGLAALILSGCNFSLAADVTPPPGYQPPPPVSTSAAPSGAAMFPVVPPNPAQGAATYVEKCAPCHGVGGMGDGPNAANLPNPVAALADPELAHGSTPSKWFDIVSNGNLDRFMPPFKSLSDRQRWDVVAYAFTLSNPPDELSRGAEVYQAECAACHGLTGAGDGPQAAGLSVPDLTEQERMAGKSEADLFTVISNGAGDKMPAFGDKLSEDDRWALTGFVRSLTFSDSLAAATTPAAPGATPPPTEAAAVLTPGAAITQTAELTATQTVSGTIGAVSGLVTTGSGDPATEGLEVNLHAFDQMQLVYTQTTTLGPDGAYLFDNLQMQPGLAFLSTVEFDGIVYGSDVAVAETGSDSLELPIRVYESTTDTGALSVDRLHYFFEFVDDDTLRVLELYIISNNSDKTIVAAEKGQPVIDFSLPPDAANLQFEDGKLGERYVQTAGGFGDTSPIRPGAGNYQVLFSYELPYTRKLDLTRSTPLTTQAVIVMAPEEGVKVKGDNLTDGGTRDVQGVAYHIYNGPALKPGGEMHLTLSGRPGAGGIKLTTSSTNNLVVGLGALGIVLLVAGAWLFSRGRLRPIEPEADLDEEEDDAQQLDTREAVMDAILALDDLYQEGKLPEDAYLQRRAALKSRLQELVGS